MKEQLFFAFYLLLLFIILNIGLNLFYFIGHSMGGKLSMVAALLNPAQFSKLVVVDVAPTITKSLEEVLKYMHAMKSIDLLSMKKRKDIEDELEKVVEVSFNISKTCTRKNLRGYFKGYLFNYCISILNVVYILKVDILTFLNFT